MSGSGILHRPIDTAHLPDGEIAIAATAGERERLAAEYELVAVNSLSATATLTPGARGSITVEGHVVADIVQTCVVSLAPVEQRIDEAFRLRFVQPQDAPPEPKPGAEVAIDPDRPEPPEVLHGPSLDLGAVVEEAFVLGIDPYPRAPGAVLAVPASPAGEEARESPFSALSGLAGRLRRDG